MASKDIEAGFIQTVVAAQLDDPDWSSAVLLPGQTKLFGKAPTQMLGLVGIDGNKIDNHHWPITVDPSARA